MLGSAIVFDFALKLTASAVTDLLDMYEFELDVVDHGKKIPEYGWRLNCSPSYLLRHALIQLSNNEGQYCLTRRGKLICELLHVGGYKPTRWYEPEATVFPRSERLHIPRTSP